jgi:hypothetical protein
LDFKKQNQRFKDKVWGKRMSTYDIELDSINNICTLISEIVELTGDIEKETYKVALKRENIKKYEELIKSKALAIKAKATRMEERLKLYKKGIEALGFKRVKKRSIK